MSEPATPETDGARRATAARSALYLTIAGLAVNLVGATTFWIALPEKMKTATEKLADHEIRLRVVEASSQTTSADLRVLNERARSIQESVTDIKAAIRDGNNRKP